MYVLQGGPTEEQKHFPCFFSLPFKRSRFQNEIGGSNRCYLYNYAINQLLQDY